MDAESLEMLRQIAELDTRNLSAEVRHLIRLRYNELFGHQPNRTQQATKPQLAD